MHPIQSRVEIFLSIWWRMGRRPAALALTGLPPSPNSTAFLVAVRFLELRLPCRCHAPLVHVASWVHHPRFSNHFRDWQETVVSVHHSHGDVGVPSKCSMNLDSSSLFKLHLIGVILLYKLSLVEFLRVVCCSIGEVQFTFQ